VLLGGAEVCGSGGLVEGDFVRVSAGGMLGFVLRHQDGAGAVPAAVLPGDDGDAGVSAGMARAASRAAGSRSPRGMFAVSRSFGAGGGQRRQPRGVGGELDAALEVEADKGDRLG
jgi:hypothetical protein